MKYIELTDTEHPLFMQAWKLYLKSFPKEERRQLRTQRQVMKNSQYRFELIFNQNQFIGFIAWWKFDSLQYIEHFATLPAMRGNGYGQRVLQNFIMGAQLPVLLEVELPKRDIDRRRIEFYQRSGFILNENPYKHPPYKKHGEYVPLMIMTYPNAIADKELQYFLEKYHPIIHKFVLD